MGGEAWQATVHGVTKSRTELSDSHTHTHRYHKFIIKTNLATPPNPSIPVLVRDYYLMSHPKK